MKFTKKEVKKIVKKAVEAERERIFKAQVENEKEKMFFEAMDRMRGDLNRLEERVIILEGRVLPEVKECKCGSAGVPDPKERDLYEKLGLKNNG